MDSKNKSKGFAKSIEEESRKVSLFTKNLQVNTVNPATQLLEKRRNLYEVQEQFDQEKKNYKGKEEGFKKKEEELKERDYEIQASLIRFSKYLTDIQAKSQRTQKRIQEEKKAIESKKEELDKKKKVLEEIKEGSIKTELKLAAMKKYEEFLETFKETYPDEFPEISDIISRYNTLKKINERLTNQHQKCDKELIDLQSRTSSYQSEMDKKIYDLNNEIADLKVELEDIKSKRNDITKKIEVSAADTRSKTTELGQLLMSINNLYERCKDKRGQYLKKRIEGDLANVKDYENIQLREQLATKQIEIISGYLQDFVKIIDETKEKKNKPGLTESTKRTKM